MKHNRSLSIFIGVGGAAFLALPIALTSYVSNRCAVIFPTIQASYSGPDWIVSPISDQKGKAIRQFKTTQV